MRIQFKNGDVVEFDFPELEYFAEVTEETAMTWHVMLTIWFAGEVPQVTQFE